MFDRGIDLDSGTLELHHPEMNDSDMHLLGKNFTTEWGGDPNNVRDGFECDYEGQTFGTFTCKYTGQVFRGHGTWVSGVIFAQKDNNEGIAGIAPGVKGLHNTVLGQLEPIPIHSERFLNASIDLAAMTQYSGKRYVVNFSAGQSCGDSNYVQGVQHLDTAGVLLVSVSLQTTPNNNENNVHYPAAYSKDYENVIAVGSTDSKDDRCVAVSGRSTAWNSDSFGRKRYGDHWRAMGWTWVTNGWRYE